MSTSTTNRSVTTTAHAEPNLGAQWAPIERTHGGVPEVTVAWVAANLAVGGWVIVDVRETCEWNDALGHVPSAELVPLATLEAAAVHWDRATPVVVMCRSGGRSGRAALLLEQLGFARVASVRGGMLAWNDARLPTERT